MIFGWFFYINKNWFCYLISVFHQQKYYFDSFNYNTKTQFWYLFRIKYFRNIEIRVQLYFIFFSSFSNSHLLSKISFSSSFFISNFFVKVFQKYLYFKSLQITANKVVKYYSKTYQIIYCLKQLCEKSDFYFCLTIYQSYISNLKLKWALKPPYKRVFKKIANFLYK